MESIADRSLFCRSAELQFRRLRHGNNRNFLFDRGKKCLGHSNSETMSEAAEKFEAMCCLAAQAYAERFHQFVISVLGLPEIGLG